MIHFEEHNIMKTEEKNAPDLYYSWTIHKWIQESIDRNNKLSLD